MLQIMMGKLESIESVSVTFCIPLAVCERNSTDAGHNATTKINNQLSICSVGCVYLHLDLVRSLPFKPKSSSSKQGIHDQSCSHVEACEGIREQESQSIILRVCVG